MRRAPCAIWDSAVVTCVFHDLHVCELVKRRAVATEPEAEASARGVDMRPVLMVRARMGQHSRFLGESATAGKPILQPTLLDDAGEQSCTVVVTNQSRGL